MSRCINQLGLGLVALVLMVFMALPASAQAAGWQPKFDDLDTIVGTAWGWHTKKTF